MSLFSSHKSAAKTGAAQDIPEEIRRAVSIMGARAASDPAPEQAMPAPKGDAPAPRTASPFLGDEPAPERAPAHEPKPSASLAPVWNPPAVSEFKPLFDDAPKFKKERKGWLKWLIGGAILLIVAVAAWWYFFMRAEVPVEPVVENPTPTPAAVIAVVTNEAPYSLSAPNYLSIDTETITPEGLRALLKQLGERIIEAKMTEPVEFLLTDKNNNPLAFSRFAYLMQLDLAPDLLAMIDESFTLSLFNDAGKATLGLGLSFVGAAETSDLFRSQREASMPYAFRTLLYDGLTVPREASFRSGLYNGQTVRYVNIDVAQNVSFDYALRGKTWLIGTSKDTLRAMLDK